MAIEVEPLPREQKSRIESHDLTINDLNLVIFFTGFNPLIQSEKHEVHGIYKEVTNGVRTVMGNYIK